MPRNKKTNFTKKDISKKIELKLGISNLYIYEIIDDLIIFLKKEIGEKQLNIKNFGTFKLLSKNERVGRNPKTNKTYMISARKSLSFIPSKKLNKKMN